MRTTVKVYSCWGGNQKYYFRLQFPNGSREHVTGTEWNRNVAREALDVCELHGLRREDVRFAHQ